MIRNGMEVRFASTAYGYESGKSWEVLHLDRTGSGLFPSEKFARRFAFDLAKIADSTSWPNSPSVALKISVVPGESDDGSWVVRWEHI